ncbi:MAG: hypothetical protein KC729_00030 [Candidatus Eisenbacteria bacterium]|uniref:Uncharacterized protein n=1 Tax=Eiseniibacteriota bacterium TaxID=2212470 RepID=A0A956LWV4_UNCEI|nr:hypothetical protein [Candidatus Eisenbacteria bacterium]
METNGDNRALNGGQGGNPSLIAEDLRNVHRRKSTARMLHRAVRACPDVTADPDFWGPIVEALLEGATHGDYRDRKGCAAVLATLRAQNLETLQHLDKNERLDDGKSTERIAHAGTVTVRIGAGKIEHANRLEDRMGAAHVNGNG